MNTIADCGFRPPAKYPPVAKRAGCRAGISDLKSKTCTSIAAFRNPQSASGFTLLEVLISLAIIGLTLTVLIHSQLLSVEQGVKAKYHTTALFLANEILSDTFMQEESLLRIEGKNFEDYPEFSWEREVEDSDIEGLKTIKITVVGPENTRIVLNTYRLQQNVMQTRTRR